ncbi:MAG: hypothetical protein M0Z31_14430 [Clostridia bacterium]|nr:hypothetical protein [Clostridia bacterium]
MKDEGRIVVAGVCGSGKSTLVQGLRKLGYDAHTVAQEHSYVPKMWQMSNPGVLIYLDADLVTVCQRRKVQWGEDRLVEQRKRLAHAREQRDLYIDTNSLTIEEVLELAKNFLRQRF